MIKQQTDFFEIVPEKIYTDDDLNWMSELPQPALRLGWGFLLRNGTPEGVPHYHHSVC